MDGFNSRVEFSIKVIPYIGNDEWVEPTIIKLKECLEGDMPAVGKAAMGGECDYCAYAKSRAQLTLLALQKKQKAKQTR